VAGINPKTIRQDNSYGTGAVVIKVTNDFEIFAYYTEDDYGTGGNVTYLTESGHVEFPVVDTIQEIVQDVLRALDHIEIEIKACKSNGGSLPVGWCY
jgi:hypothetical protein